MASPPFVKKLEYLGREIIYRLMGLLLPRKKNPGPLAAGKIRKVAVMRIEEKIGDLLMTVPLMRSIKLTFPDAYVVAIVGVKQVKLIRGIPGVDEVIGFDKRAAMRPWNWPAILRQMRAHRFDVAFEASSWNTLSINSVLLLKLTVPHRLSVGHDTRLADRFFDYRPPLREDHNEIRRTLGLLDAAENPNFTEEVTLPDWPIPEKVDRLLTEKGLAEKRFMLVHPGAYRKVRRWNYPAHSYFCKKVKKEFGLDTLVIYGTGEQNEEEQLRSELDEFPILGPDLTLEEVVGLMRRACFVMTMNSGPMHLSVGSTTPTLAFAVGIDEYQWGYPAGGHLMLGSRNIGTDPDAVFDAARDWMKKTIESRCQSR